MATRRSAAVSRRAIEPSSDPRLRTAARSCAAAHPPWASGQAARSLLAPAHPPTPHPAPLPVLLKASYWSS